MDILILKGNICHTPVPGLLESHPGSYIIAEGGICKGIFEKIPEAYSGIPVQDFGDCLIIPGMIDLHIHAPQYAYRGLGMDYELLDWLNYQAFPEEMKYADLEYASRAYRLFADQMKKSATTRAVIFATVHQDATLLLMNLMEETGVASYVGKVNMDRNAPDGLREANAESSIINTRSFIEASLHKGYGRTLPILTPRFIPSCSEELLLGLSNLQQQYNLPVQSHLSENPEEVKLVGELMPQIEFYGDGYDRYGLFGRSARTVMAHCIYSTDEEIERMKQNGVWIAHCPNSNMNVCSGIAPIRRYLDSEMRVGLGSDVAGGQTESIFRAITDTIQVSKLYFRYIDADAKPISFPESLYLATKGGGSFFGKVGSFEEGYEFDAIVLDDSMVPHPQPLSVEQRLERAVYLGLDQFGIRAKYVCGDSIL